MVLPVYFDCFDETPDSAASPGAMAVNEWWHMFDVWLSHSKHRHKFLHISNSSFSISYTINIRAS